jgi:CheY-like chemotaxis protein/HPt (histidine-containing phosphotransfer) domain-containing protein
MPATPQPLRVLIVDDDAVMTELLLAVFGLEGHEPVTAESGEAALTLLQTTPFDVVLTDLQLPGLHGAALAAALRSAIPPTTRLFGMSGSQPSNTDLAAYDAFLLKPFTVEDFTAALTSAKSSSTPGPSAPDPGPSSTPILDEAIVTRLAKQLPEPKLRELYQLTLDDIAKRLNRMAASQSDGDEDAIRREAHAIKGGCGMVGATELHRLAALREGGSPPDTPPLVDFHAAHDRLKRMLDARFKGQ